jgi:hypothetical protein
MLLVVLFWSPVLARAQESTVSKEYTSTLPARTDTLFVTGGGPFLIHPYLVESSLRVWSKGNLLPATHYFVDFRQGFITFNEVGPDSSFSFSASYQFIPLDLEQEYRLWEKSDEAGKAGSNRRVSSQISQRIRSSGSITRGVMSGTGRDASVESGLRLEVEGEITDSIHVRAVLTDEDSPLLPEGTTSRLDQFDQVFIAFESGKGRVSLGDIDISLQQGNFTRVKRRIQGVELATNPFSIALDGRLKGEIQAIGSTSKGKFRSQFIPIREGVQGPYRLEGDTSERFILVLPGTERVYIDGQLQERGFDADYIIDYTTAEITFTPSRLVGSDSRVRVEFEYTTNQYTRSLLAAESEVSVPLSRSGLGFSLGVSAIREADGENFAEELGFTAQDSVLISQAGDELVLKSSAVPVAYDPQALFTQYFSIVGFDGMPAFKAVDRTPSLDESVYRVTFTRVGSGKGSYTRAGNSTTASTSNGIVFTYVGQGNGDYDSVKPLTAPGRKELLGLRFKSTGFRFASIDVEYATSNYDQNTLSVLDALDDAGTASRIQFSLKPISWNGIRFSAETEWGSRSAHFSTFDRIRDIEYEQEWNLARSTESVSQSLIVGQSERSNKTSLKILSRDSSSVEIGYDGLSIGQVVDANKLRMKVAIPEKTRPAIDFRGQWVSSQDARLARKSDWVGMLTRLSKREFSGFNNLGFEWETERFSGDQHQVSTEIPIKNYDEFRVAGLVGSESNNVNLTIEQRFENEVLLHSNQLSIQTVQGKWSFSELSALRSSVSLGLRRRSGSESSLSQTPNARNSLMLGLIGEWDMREGNRLNWTYSVQSEQSARMQEIYIRTGQERGQYVWEDFNGDDVIQIEEFIPETIPGEGEYALTYFPSDSLESITSLNASVRFRRAGGGGGNRLSRIGLGTSVEVTEKSKDDVRSHIYLMQLGTFRTPGQTVNGRLRIAQDISLMPTNTTWDVDLSLVEIRGFSDLSSGLQKTQMAEQTGLIRYHSNSTWTASTRLTRKNESSIASYASRSFDINGYEIQPEVTYRPMDRWMLQSGLMWATRTEKRNNAKVSAVQIPLTGQYQMASRWTARARVEWSNAQITGLSQGLQTYQLTEGRGPGKSWIWGLSFRAQLSEVVTSSVSYDGRSPSNGPTIHTGRVQFMARF